ncbi:sigma-54-dependent Fis family transcriptional regulator [Pseudomonas coleopterorum]|uniref:sigma-54-dependent Fis family transcriptional regulator n=1 Tax=Pseudomonas coleopterorum TaxID=1605838 RepID=UPI001785C175|nr:sigma-54-dependent Fis family transcriptional regulator [Pseudomonas coleopterorum]MBD8482874.1 sigma-54-dependent Fis family transcriptional regulator [Pseudomonas coleopterorum]
MSVSNPTLAHDQLIQRSWARCREAGLEHHHVPRFEPLARVALQQMLDGHQALLHTTHREVLPYYEHILGNSRCLIRLADPQARLLRSWGAQPGAGAGHLGHAPGACWLEAAAGTNPIGTALACRQAVHVEPDEHFLLANRLMNGSASPIFDAQRQMVAVLDVSSDSHLPPSHTLGLVKMMSQTVENRLILEAFADRHHQLIFNTGVNNLDSQWAGLLVFDDSGRVLAANRRADSLLGAELPGLTLQQLFRLTPQALLDHPPERTFALQPPGRSRLQCLLKKPALRPAPPAVRRGSDPRLDKALQQGLRLLEKDVPLLLRGDTGTGKEVLVKALHRASSRASCPLIAVNCAAIPTDLVESELFGYERGAFTGASHKGSPGLVRKADKGILFLDEIGDMPLPTQARLLRVLQERCIQPLGGGDPLPVDIRLVSATHEDLRQRVQAGLFREDLYYRLAGMTLHLPTLNERSDKRELIEQVWEAHREAQQTAGFSDAVWAAFMVHPWPGNVRQLAAVVKVALVLADQDVIGLEHLPEDFLLEAGLQPPQAPASPRPLLTLAKVSDLGELLQASDGNISRLARRLGVSRNTLYKRLRAQGHAL